MDNLLIGIATSNFTYGNVVKLKIMNLDTEQGETKRNITSNLENDSLDEIQIGNYHSTSEMEILIPHYMAYEYRCGCSKCSPNKSGYKGERFLILILPPNNPLGKEYVVVSKI